MSDYDPERVLRVACPTCGAQEGERCKTKSGKTRAKHDYHSTRKNVVYPEFFTVRPTPPSPSKKAKLVLEAIEEYVVARIGFGQCRTGDEFSEMTGKLKKAKADLQEALKEGFTGDQ